MKNFVIIFFLMSLVSLGSRASTSASVILASNYIWRGVSFTSNGLETGKGTPVIQASLDYGHESGFGLSLFAGNVDTYNFDKDLFEKDSESDLTLSYSREILEHLRISFLVTSYIYVINSSNNSVDFQMVFDWKPFRLGVSYMDNYFGTKSSDFYSFLGLRKYVEGPVGVFSHVGYSNFGDKDRVGFENYVDYRIGIFFERDSWNLDFAYSSTDRKDLAGEHINDKAVAFSLALAL